MDKNDLKQRTKIFALRIIKLVKALPGTIEGRAIGNQIIRSGTSEIVAIMTASVFSASKKLKK